MKNTKNSKNKSGFTLIEVVLALAILGMSFAVLFGLAGTSMRTSARAETVTIATMLARQKMAEEMIRIEKDAAEGKFPDTNEDSSGKFDEPYDKYQWLIHVRKVEIPIPPEGEQGVQAQLTQMIAKEIGEALREVKLTVLFDDSIDKEEVVVTTHVAKK